MDLFSAVQNDILSKNAPLAERMKPQKLSDFVGQGEILGEGKKLRKLIESDMLTSIIFYGPSGTGKTSIARIIAKQTNSNFVSLNAVTSGIKELREVIAGAKDDLSMYGKRTILFIDEIHRFNKTQQDALLPHVEKGVVSLIGATTENPYYEINRALLSRSMLFELKMLEYEEIKIILQRAIKDDINGLGMFDVNVDEAVYHELYNISSGDARRALNTLEMAVMTADKVNGKIYVTDHAIRECIQHKGIFYDKNGDSHYDITSAFIKSMRGSDPDATVHYLARMLEGGEDIKFIARRIVICASEDVGNADPQALVIAASAMQAVQMIGMPEARIILSQAAVYVANAPKSNATYIAIDKAIADVRAGRGKEVPYHLRDMTAMGMKHNKEGVKGEVYKYPHNYPDGKVEQEYMPSDMKDVKYFNGEF